MPAGWTEGRQALLVGRCPGREETDWQRPFHPQVAGTPQSPQFRQGQCSKGLGKRGRSMQQRYKAGQREAGERNGLSGKPRLGFQKNGASQHGLPGDGLLSVASQVLLPLRRPSWTSHACLLHLSRLLAVAVPNRAFPHSHQEMVLHGTLLCKAWQAMDGGFPVPRESSRVSECECNCARIPKPALLLASFFHELLHGIRLRRRRAKHSQTVVQGTPTQKGPQQMRRRQSLSLSQSASQPASQRSASQKVIELPSCLN